MIDYLIYILIMIGIYGILSLSLNFQFGFTGLANFGHVVFFCLGAYASTFIVVVLGAPIILGFCGGMAIAGIFGYLISLPTANLKADYWAIVTLAAAEIVRIFLLNEESLFPGSYQGGAYGVAGIPSPLKSVIPPAFYPFFYLFLVLFFLAFTYFVFHLLTSSPFGRVLKAIREGEDLPLAMAKNVSKFRMKVMAIGGSFAGLAGSLLAHFWTFVDPYQFMPIETFVVWAMVVVGGRGNNLGVLIGTVIIQFFYSSTAFFKDYIPIDPQVLASLRMVVIGILIVLVLLFMSEGLIKEGKRHIKNSDLE